MKYQFLSTTIILLLLIGKANVNAQTLTVEGDAQIKGRLELQAAVSDITSIFIGFDTGKNDDGNNGNLFIGQSSGYSNIDGSRNIFLGRETGYKNTSGNNNIFLGERVGYSNISGDNNTFMGYATGYSNTTGRHNLFLGQIAGYSNTTGNYNIFFGKEAGFQNTSGEDNIFIGRTAGYFNTTGENNSFIGSGAGKLNRSGSLNTFIGNGTGYSNSHGTANTFVGSYSGENNGIGSANTFMGFYAGNWHENGEANTAIGTFAGAINENGDYNTFLGASADFLDTDTEFNRAIAIGYKAKVNCSNCAVIGGIGEDSVRVGIGTPNPNERLEVIGNVKASKFIGDGTLLSNVDKQTIDTLSLEGTTLNISLKNDGEDVKRIDLVTINTDTQTLSLKNGTILEIANGNAVDLDSINNWRKIDDDIFNLNTGNVGIGTVDPQAKLDVNGKVRISDIPVGAGNLVLVDSSGNLLRTDIFPDFNPAIIEDLKRENQQLQKRLDQLERLVEQLIANTDKSHKDIKLSLDQTYLYQNQPNPFNETTSIRYFIPSGSSESRIHIIDLEGKTFKVIPINGNGKGQLNIEAHSLSSGIYFYSLIVDGELIATKKMISTNSK